MKYCDACHSSYPGDFTTCPKDQGPLREISDLVPGLVLRGKYAIVEKLGAGGMGAVYRARHVAFGEVRAIKVIGTQVTADDTMLARFRAEAVLARKLSHPNIVRVEDLDATEDGRPFIVMEYVEGDSLRKILRRTGALAVGTAVEIARQACAALAAAHAIGIVHRDIKPDNMVIVRGPDGGDLVKVLDFGLAKVLEGFEGESLGPSTLTGLIMGTPQYLSPEQAQASRETVLDGRVDIYALGIVLHEMVTGSLPFQSDTPMGMLWEHIRTAPVAPHTRYPERGIPPALSHIVLRALAKDRNQRFASAAEMGEALRALAATLPAAPPVSSSAGRMAATLATPVEQPGKGGLADSGAVPTPATAILKPHMPTAATTVRPRRPPTQPVRVATQRVAETETSSSGWGAAVWAVFAIAVLGAGFVVVRRPASAPPSPSPVASSPAAGQPLANEPASNITDDAVQADIRRLLFASSALREARIDVTVINGIVTLAGEVPTATAGDLATSLAASAPGVRRVFNTFSVAAKTPAITEAAAEPAPPVTEPPATRPPAPTPDPKQEQVRGMLGQARQLVDAGKHEEANRLFEEVLRIDPDNPIAKEATGRYRTHPPPPGPPPPHH